MGTMRVEYNGPRLRIQWTWPGLEPETVSLGCSSLPIWPMHLPTNNGWNQIFINIGNWSRKIMNILYLILPAGGNSHIKRMRCSSPVLKRIPKRYQDPVFPRHGLKWFFLLFLRDSSSHTAHLSRTTFIWLNFTLKGSTKAPIVSFNPEHPERYQNNF